MRGVALKKFLRRYQRPDGRGVLIESCMAEVALVRLLPCVDSEVTFQPEYVRTGVCAVGTLVRPLSTVASHVSLQLAQLHCCVVTVRTLVRLLMGVFISHMSCQRSTSGELSLAMLALVRFCPSVCVLVVLQRCKRFEATLTHGALVGLLLAVRSHVP